MIVRARSKSAAIALGIEVVVHGRLEAGTGGYDRCGKITGGGIGFVHRGDGDRRCGGPESIQVRDSAAIEAFLGVA